MFRYYIKRILGIFPVLLMVAFISYGIVALFPGNFYTRYRLLFAMQATGDDRRQDALETYEALLALRGLDKPWYTQFYYWIEGIVCHGSLGFSFAQGESVTKLVLGRDSPLWWTLVIIGSSIVVGWMVGVPLGVLGAVYYRRPIDTILYAATYVIAALPPFVLGMLFFIVNNFLRPDHMLLPGAWGIVDYDLLYSVLTWEKAFSHLQRLSLTWLIVGMPIVVIVSRHLRANLLEVLAQPYMVTARGKGLANLKIVFKHGVRNAVNPLISMSGDMLTTTIANSILAGAVLNQPSFGEWIVASSTAQDQPLATAILLLFGVLLTLGTLGSDLLLCAIDPRIRYN
jgi:peptide/nickel transport system permease protein